MTNLWGAGFVLSILVGGELNRAFSELIRVLIRCAMCWNEPLGSGICSGASTFHPLGMIALGFSIICTKGRNVN